MERKEGEIRLTEERRQSFNVLIKIGVYKELYKRNMLTGEQLMRLLQGQGKTGVCIDDAGRI